MERNDLLALMKTVARADKKASVAYNYNGETFGYSELDDTLRDELRSFAGNYRAYEQNKNYIFALIEETLEEILPKRVMDQWAAFAEFKTVAQGNKAVFKRKISEASRRRAKSFIGKVGMAGRYEVFKLEGTSLEVNATAIGGAAQISIEEYLDGRIDFADILDFVLEAMTDSIFYEIQKQMLAAVSNIQAYNKYSGNAFVEAEFDKLIARADSYGTATIFCTYEFAATMLPGQNWISDTMKDEKWHRGYLANYKGHTIVILPQSMVDETNGQKVIDPSYCWIVGGDAKPAKVVFEGGPVMKDFDNRDFSMEVQVYQKVGVAIELTPNFFSYRNTSLTR